MGWLLVGMGQAALRAEKQKTGDIVAQFSKNAPTNLIDDLNLSLLGS